MKKEKEHVKKNKMGALLLAAMICMAGVVILFGGMSFYAGREGNQKEELVTENETATEKTPDVIEEVLAEQEKEEESSAVKLVTGEETNYLMVPFEGTDAQMAYAQVPILTWDEYYLLSPGGEEHITGDGIFGTLSENELPMEEAGKIGMEELYRIFAQDMEETMYLIMWLDNAGEGNGKIDIWNGYLTNMINGQSLEKGWKRISGYFGMNALTGEVFYTNVRIDTENAQEPQPGEELSKEELLKMADMYLKEYGLADGEALQGEITDEQWDRWTHSMYVAQVSYDKNGVPYLRISLNKYTGAFMGYLYYDDLSF